MSSVRSGRAVIFASLTVMAYDYVCTLEKEINYVWKQPFMMGCLLFYINRYLPFVVLMLAISIMLPDVDPETCYVRFKVICCLVMLSFIVSQIILILRTYAMWGRKRWVLICLLCTGVFCLSPSIVITLAVVVPALHFEPVRIDGPGCRVTAASNLIAVPYLLILISETVVVGLTLVRTYKYLRYSNSTWIHQLHQQGLLFYGYMFIITISNTIYPFLVPSHQKNNLAMIQHMAHSLLCSRVIFLILEQREKLTMTHATTVPNRSLVLSTVMFDGDGDVSLADI
ncbi:unnamed protein product [Cyclocybe aegerita]|uniref:DUF6533 domain-containing protein n=1 Tax=Cyclocybe aegerita TaxID=1973307 RepID=A0A8S0VTZ7_CYCAE|nr:unnamed protein product [Cyclocybe aegerita]